MFQAHQSGQWARALAAGFSPEAHFGPEVFLELVSPAVLSARQQGGRAAGPPVAAPAAPAVRPPVQAGPGVLRLVCMGQELLVHKGLLQAHGMDCFGVGDQGG